MTRRTTKRYERGNEPTAEKEIVGTSWLLQIFSGEDRQTHAPYYHYRFVRMSDDGSRTFSTARPIHLIQQVAALMVACRGFSQLPIEESIRKELGIIADHLAKIPLPQLSDGRSKSSGSYVNGIDDPVGSAFGTAA